MRTLGALLALVTVMVLAGGAGASGTQQSPPLPHAANGGKVGVIASGLPLPVGLAVGKGTVFVAAFGSEDGKTPGGLYAVRGGTTTQLESGMFIGIAWRGGVLYAGKLGRTTSTVLAFKGWSGHAFASRRAIRHARVSFLGFAVGPDGRLYMGGGTENCERCKQKSRLAQAVLSMRLDGSDLKVVARGLRQPYGIAFAHGSRAPYVTVEGQEGLGRKEPPDYVIHPRLGENYGFPTCNWSKPARCRAFAKPLALFPAHSSPTGIAAIGSQLYIGMFGGTRGPAVWRLPRSGGTYREVVSGFVAPVVGVAASGRTLFVSDLTGSVYRITTG